VWSSRRSLHSPTTTDHPDREPGSGRVRSGCYFQGPRLRSLSWRSKGGLGLGGEEVRGSARKESGDRLAMLSLDRGSRVRSVRSDTAERWWLSILTRLFFFFMKKKIDGKTQRCDGETSILKRSASEDLRDRWGIRWIKYCLEISPSRERDYHLRPSRPWLRRGIVCCCRFITSINTKRKFNLDAQECWLASLSLSLSLSALSFLKHLFHRFL
jgi:hypothetical protein